MKQVLFKIKITNVISDEQLESMINDDDSNIEISQQEEDEATKKQAKPQSPKS